ncbi:hypothetical protein [Dactylosporangium sp. NPDC048998]|uniref:hypothetical protein n=1 Tax=Dactylosporangium sp. NPDC048998 TaxID=3363976 RepID=UPI003713ADFF
MILIPLLLAPAVMAAAALIERRLGPSAAGWVAALPLAFAVAVAAVTVDANPQAAGSMALSAAAHVPAQVVLGVVLARVLRRRGLISGAVCGASAYVICSFVVHQVPAALAVAVAVGALAVAPRLMPSAQPRLGSPRHWSTTALTCLCAAAIVAAAVLSSRLAGPDLAGAIAAFPTMCTTLTVVAVTRDGAIAGVHTLVGLVRSLPCYLAFCLVVALSAPVIGLAGVGLGLLACLAMAGVTWRRVPIAPAVGFDAGGSTRW